MLPLLLVEKYLFCEKSTRKLAKNKTHGYRTLPSFYLSGNKGNEEVFAMDSDECRDAQFVEIPRKDKTRNACGDIESKTRKCVEGYQHAHHLTIEPIVPYDDRNPPQIALPHSVETTGFKNYEFISTTIEIRSATATQNACPRKLCDAQTLLENCGCTSAASKRIWVLTISFTREELQHIEDNDSITSHATTDIFVKAAKREI